MEGEILDRDTDFAANAARVAEQLAARAQEKSDSNAAAEWNGKAAEARARENELYAKSKEFWKSIYDADAEDYEKDTYAGARSLRIEAMEMRSQGRFEEAVATLDQARWMSNEFWNVGTELMLKIKQEANLPLALTDTGYLERKAVEIDYRRHLPKSIAATSTVFPM